MKAMVLAAGRGERLRPLTDHTPKPMLKVRGQPLIHRHLAALAHAGFEDVVINLSWLGAAIREGVGDGSHFGLRVRYSQEPPGALEAGGGICEALPLLGTEPFLVVNGDVYTDIDFARLRIGDNALAHLVLVPNPEHHPRGDFVLQDGEVREGDAPRLTYAGVGIYRPEMFAQCARGRFPLLPLLRGAIAERRLHGERHEGLWVDVGSPERFAALNGQPDG
jgi:MurNAc alpha-1-phosphate uridylyltransferase